MNVRALGTFGAGAALGSAFAECIKELAERKSLVITGDFNCAHQNLDIHSPWTNKKTPGFTEVCKKKWQRAVFP